MCVCVGGGGGGGVIHFKTGKKVRAVVVMQVRVTDL